ncbi:MAG: ABC transporter permease [Rectinemataceae bacterium]
MDKEQQARMNNGNIFRSFFKRADASAIVATVFLFFAFSSLTRDFLTSFNQYYLWMSAAQNVFISLGQAMALLVGGMNLSLGAIGGLTVVILGYSIEVLKLNPILAVLLGLLVGVVTGLFNGFFISRMKLNSFVVTLASSFIFQGLVNGISQGKPYSEIPQSFTVLGNGSIFGVPDLVYLMILALILIYYLFRYTVVGRRLLATGGNINAARLSGINTSRMIFLANILSGVCASVAGILWVSRMGTAQPATGSDWMIISFAVAIIGGTSLYGGSISAVGFLFAGLLMALIRNGLIMIGANVYFESTFLGLIILLAISVEFLRMRMQSRVKKT